MVDISFLAEHVARHSPSHSKQQGTIAVHGENVNYREQVTEQPIIPILDRAHPVLDWIKTRETLIPGRRKLLGAAGVVDPSELRGQRFGAGGYGGRYSEERRQPTPYPTERFRWPAEKDVGRLPSVIAEDVTTGPTRTVSPQEVCAVI